MFLELHWKTIHNMLEFNIKQSHLKLLSERIHLLKYQCKLRKALSSLRAPLSMNPQGKH